MLLSIQTSRWKYAGWVVPWTVDPVSADKRVVGDAHPNDRPVPPLESTVFGPLAS